MMELTRQYTGPLRWSLPDNTQDLYDSLPDNTQDLYDS